MSKKTILLATLVAGLALPGFAESIQVNGNPLPLDQAPVIVNGQMLVPMRGVFESLGGNVQFDPMTHYIRATQGKRVVQMMVGSPTASVDGQVMTLSTPPQVLAGRTLIPLRFVAQALGAEVQWAAATRSVAINTPTTTSTFVRNVKPELTSVIHNAPAGLHVGDRLVVTMAGDEDAQATFEILGMGSPVAMREVTSGRYEGETVIGPEIHPGAVTLVGHLSKNGRESTLAASQLLAILGDPVLPPPMTISPAPGTVVETPRPQVSVLVQPPLAPESTRLLLDGQDVTRQARWAGSQLTFEPSSDLAGGAHGVEVIGLDSAGHQHSQGSNFQVRQTVTGSTGKRQSMDVSLTNLEPGSGVSDVFNVEGKTVPYANVLVSLDTTLPMAVGQRPVTSSTAKADGDGYFNVDLDARAVPQDSPMTLHVQARDSEGRQGPMRTLEVIRR